MVDSGECPKEEVDALRKMYSVRSSHAEIYLALLAFSVGTKRTSVQVYLFFELPLQPLCLEDTLHVLDVDPVYGVNHQPHDVMGEWTRPQLHSSLICPRPWIWHLLHDLREPSGKA